jgi:hypothetical protein
VTEQRSTWLNQAEAVFGGWAAVASMVRTALTPPAQIAPIADARWVAQTANHVLALMEESRSSWQIWHVRAEVQRQIRTATVPVERASALVDVLVAEVLDRRSVVLVAPHDGIEEPQALRRANGSSVYRVTGARCSALPRPRPRPLFLASRLASAPTPSPSSPGLCGTVSCLTGRPRSARRHW